jgi:beta-xylosidase
MTRTGADVKKIGLVIAALFATATSASGPSEQAFVPVLSVDFPDPFVLRHGSVFLAYATNATDDRANVQMARSTNLVDWALIAENGKLHDAMPQMQPWARAGLTWAPEVIKTDTGFVLHFTARDKKSDLQCLGAAFSVDPLGPFTSDADAPLLCQTKLGGTIDSHAFRDADGQLYLYYKNDGNNPNFKKPTDIYVQRLTPDGLNVTGDEVALVRNDTPWEAHVIEAPTMVRNGDNYIMFFSANHYGWETHQKLSVYAMGYATCDGPMGPCKDATRNPLLYSYKDRKAGCLSGPGHQSVFEVGTRQFISFHAHAALRNCTNAKKGRYMYIAPLFWENGEPTIGSSLRAPAKAKARR